MATAELQAASPSSAEAHTGLSVRIRLLGGFLLSFNAQTIPIKSKKSQAILAFACLQPEASARRDTLQQLLWPDAGCTRSQCSLRHSLWQIGQCLSSLPVPLLSSNRQTIQLSQTQLSVDVLDALAELERGRVPEALHHNPLAFDSLFSDLEHVSPEFYQWATAKRTLFQQQLISTTQHALEHSKTSQPHTLKLCELMSRADPLNESATQMIMSYRAKNGDTAGALAAYQRLWHDMDQQQGMEPSAKTQEHAVKIKTGEVGYQQSQADQDPRPWIYLETPDTSGLSQAQAALLIGFHQELLAGLIRFREWRVGDFSRAKHHPGSETASAFRLSLTPVETEEHLRLIVTLKDLHRDAYLWSERVQHSTNSWRQSQSALVQTLALSLNLQISDEHLRTIGTRESFSLSVYDKWLLAESKTKTFKHGAWLEARGLLRELIGSEHSFSRAYSSLAQMDNSMHFVFPGVDSHPERRQRALTYARKSVQLDPLDSRNQLSLAWAHAMKGQFDCAGRTFLRAAELNENDPWTSISAALGLAFCDEPILAHSLAHRSIQIDPNPSPLHSAYQAAIAFLRQDYQTCIEHSQLAEHAMSDVLAWQSAAYALTQNTSKAQRCMQLFLQQTRNDWHGEKEPNNHNIGTWLCRCFPIKNLTTWQTLREGLRDGGLDLAPIEPPVGSVASKPKQTQPTATTDRLFPPK